MRAFRRIWLAAALAWGLSVTAPAEDLRIRIKANEVQGLLYCLEALRGDPLHSKQLAAIFRQRRGQHPEDETALAAFSELEERSEWAHLRLPGENAQWRGLGEALDTMAVSALSEEDFLERASAILTVGQQQLLQTAVRHFAPLYHQLIWNPNQTELMSRADQIVNALGELQASQRLGKVASFYASLWPGWRDFWVVLTPIPRQPEERVVSRGYSDGFLVVVDIVGGADAREHAGIIFHELCHSLWSIRSPETISSLIEVFSQKGRWGWWAYRELNEALSTALGNGWLGGAAQPAGDAKVWYGDPVVDDYAKALYPEVVQRVEGGGHCDAAFAEVAMRIFRHKFPRAEYDCWIRLRYLIVITTRAEDPSLPNRLRSLGPIQTVAVLSPAQVKGFEQPPDVAFLHLDGSPARCLIQEGQWHIYAGGSPDQVMDVLRRTIEARFLKEGPI